MQIRNDLRSIDVLSGVPQGSVLVPLLFIAYTADIKNIITSSFAMFADDIKLYNSCDNFSPLLSDLRSIYKWSQIWLLPINLDKCVTLDLDKGNSRHVYNSIGSYGLATTECHMGLGVHVYFSLLWSDHVLQVTKKANKMLFLLSKIFVKPSPLDFSQVYKT
ncbi:hypothetical protein Zmor_024158 [Zophobas morio]|uniref:Reverse transcriptase domain-containing protein n=1 Tax=Zophobas morio TaxID=2755281 RepID=A0AA38I066_9CUCU|nr:hypothetical protein Zmor_024158 [Zophobas morio]